MGKTLTARVSDELNQALDEISEEEKLDKSAVARRLLEKAVRNHKVEKALERYENGEITLRKAAEEADLNLWEIMDEIKERDIKAQYSEEDLEEDIKAVRDE